MEYRDAPEQTEFRAQVRGYLDERRDRFPTHDDLDREAHYGGGTADRLKIWRKELGDRRWLAPGWPTEYGGAGLSVLDQFVLNEELAEAGVPSVAGSGISMLGPTLILHGTEEQKKEFLGPTLRTEIRWCQGYSEPGAGSDLAGLSTRARRDGDDYLITGQKIWTGGAHRADWMFMLARTDPGAPKHRGISYFILDMKQPGVTVRPLQNMAGVHQFNEVFFDEARVSTRHRIGEENRGWYVATTTLDFERSAVGNAVSARKDIEVYLTWLRANPGDPRAANLPAARSELADRWIEAAVAKQLSLRIITMQAQGLVPNYEASMAKLYLSELKQRTACSVMKLFGMYGGVRGGSDSVLTPRAQVSLSGTVGNPCENYMFTVPATIGGGTSEIQRNIVATRGLGLPR